MEAFLIKAAQLIAAFALLVIIHEFGHYIFARMFGIKVEKFYLFFDPWFSLAKWRPKKKEGTADGKATWRDTEYGIGWIPLGGYVKIAGMIDESMDKEQMKLPPQPWEFRTKPAYQRLLVMVAGVLMNFLLAIVIYAGIAWHWGEKYIEFADAKAGMTYVDAAKKLGFQDGDIPLMADGKAVSAADPSALLKFAEAHKVTVLRDGRDTVSINLPDNFILRLNDEKGFFTYRLPVVIAKTVPGEPAAEAGLLAGDSVIAVNGIPAGVFNDFTTLLADNASRPVALTFKRDGQTMTANVTPTSGGKIGIQLTPVNEIYPVHIKEYSLFSAIPKGVQMGVDRLTAYASSMKYVATADGAKTVGGFGALGDMFPDQWNWLSFWEITAFLSVALAFMNILPIPALDGGHIMFLLYEIVSRRKPSEKFMEYAQICGMAFLILLLVYANGNDLYRFFIK